jgi:hypothetical protein
MVSSSSGGDYICPLYGHCIPPRPQGPITIKVGSSASVPFKNVFAQAAIFNFVVVGSSFIVLKHLCLTEHLQDNPAFSVKATENIGPKKVVTMVITAHTPPANAAGIVKFIEAKSVHHLTPHPIILYR